MCVCSFRYFYLYVRSGVSVFLGGQLQHTPFPTLQQEQRCRCANSPPLFLPRRLVTHARAAHGRRWPVGFGSNPWHFCSHVEFRGSDMQPVGRRRVTQRGFALACCIMLSLPPKRSVPQVPGAAMTQQGATLQNYNNELVKCASSIERICQLRESPSLRLTWRLCPRLRRRH